MNCTRDHSKIVVLAFTTFFLTISTMNYVPGQGTELALNGESLGVILGADFAYAVFAIWIGNAPIDESFRNTLLGI